MSQMSAATPLPSLALAISLLNSAAAPSIGVPTITDLHVTSIDIRCFTLTTVHGCTSSRLQRARADTPHAISAQQYAWSGSPIVRVTGEMRDEMVRDKTFLVPDSAEGPRRAIDRRGTDTATGGICRPFLIIYGHPRHLRFLLPKSVGQASKSLLKSVLAVLYEKVSVRVVY